MNQDLTVDNDLQKAIDDITKTTDADPVFADTVAAPEPVAPVMEALEPIPVPVPELAPEPVAQEPIPAPAMPELIDSTMPPVEVFEATPAEPAPVAEVAEVTTVEQPLPPVESTTVDEIINMPVTPAEPEPSAPTDINQIKAAALNDLTPLLNEIVPKLKNANIKPSTKFRLYEKIITELGDQDAISSAYETANQIDDDKERSEALLSLVEVIDQL